MKMLKEEREFRKFLGMYVVKSTQNYRGKSKTMLTALIQAVEDRCAETIKECKGIPYDRVDTGGRKWIHASADVVAAAIQTGRRK